jgi:hypothetical protein
MTNKIFILLISMFLFACGSPKTHVPIIEDHQDPKMITEVEVRNAVKAYLQNGGGPIASTYNVVLADLNGDHAQEGIVMMNTPFNTWCASSGCTLLVFENSNGKITLNSRIEQIREPLYIHDTNDTWHSIVSRHDGGSNQAIYIELKNTGLGYPSSSFGATPYQGNNPRSGLGYFY